MTGSVHHIQHYPTNIAGMEAMSLMTEHRFPRHAHDQFGIGVMTYGAQRSWSSVGLVEATVGDIIMVNPGEIHDGVPFVGPRGWQMIYLNPQLVTDEIGDLPAPVLRPAVQDIALCDTLLQLFNEVRRDNPDKAAIEEAYLLSLMRISRLHLLTERITDDPDPTVKLAKECLDDTPASAHSLDDLATLCSISKFQLLRRFSLDMGITPHAYLTQLRVRLARKFLAEGIPPADVAARVGFADQSHLTRAFVRQFAVTPGRFQAIAGY